MFCTFVVDLSFQFHVLFCLKYWNYISFGKLLYMLTYFQCLLRWWRLPFIHQDQDH